MPVTPFHFGPGAVLKVVGGDWFSFGAFALVQVAIDVESGFNMLTGRYPAVHLPSAAPAGWTPIVVGAVLGAVTHVLLDAVIHADARPFGEGNPLYVPGSFVPMHVLCLAAGAVGVGLCIARARRAGQGPSRRAASVENPIR
jgi:hypothetical protein